MLDFSNSVLRVATLLLLLLDNDTIHVVYGTAVLSIFPSGISVI